VLVESVESFGSEKGVGEVDGLALLAGDCFEGVTQIYIWCLLADPAAAVLAFDHNRVDVASRQDGE